jgi:hypothetical protein
VGGRLGDHLWRETQCGGKAGVTLAQSSEGEGWGWSGAAITGWDTTRGRMKAMATLEGGGERNGGRRVVGSIVTKASFHMSFNGSRIENQTNCQIRNQS